MASPYPNPASRNSQSRRPGAGWQALPAEGRREVAPELPMDLLEWPAVVEAWEAWWSSPMATRWTDADAPGVVLMARALQRGLMGSSAATAEFRLLADRYGLSPLSRSRLRWLLEDEQPGAALRATVDADVVPLRAVASDGDDE